MSELDIIPADERCWFCTRRRVSLLCDFPTGAIRTSLDFKTIRTTCDKPMCESCATHIAADTDFCPKCMEWVRTLKRGANNE